MSNVTEINSQPQHYRVTLADAIAHYQAGDLTAKGLLHFYFKIRIAPGWSIKKSQKEICSELGISRASFFNALSRLKNEGVIEWSVPVNTQFTIRLNGIESYQSTILDSQSTILDSQSTILDSQSTILDSQSTILDEKRPKPAPVKEPATPSYSSSDSYQIFLKSLSEEERERFLNFQKRKAKKLPEYPSSEGWFRKNFEHHAEEWRESEGKTAPAASQDAKWQNDPRREEWLAQIAANPDFFEFIQAGSTQEEKVQRKNFHNWAEDNGFVPGLEVAS